MAFSRKAFVVSKNTLYGSKFAESSYFVVHQDLVNLSQPVFNCPFDTSGHFVRDDLNEIRGKRCGCQRFVPFPQDVGGNFPPLLLFSLTTDLESVAPAERVATSIADALSAFAQTWFSGRRSEADKPAT